MSPPQPTQHLSGSIAGQQSYDLSKFVLESVLSNSTDRKMICCLGRFTDRGGGGIGDDHRAIVIFEKTAFATADLCAGDDNRAEELEEHSDARTRACYFSSASRLRELFVNDIYGNFECFPCPDINPIKTTIICPATESHIIKHSTQELFIFEESPEDYERKTLPHIEAEQLSLDWVYNILDGRSERERIVVDDVCPRNGFILLPDLKWDGRTRDTLYLLAIVRRRNIRSLRDLSADDLPLLRNIQQRGSAAIEAKYNVAPCQLRIYLHYQPSFYHLHVHFTYLLHTAPGIHCERGHLLQTVIGNLELATDYYRRATLPFTVVRQHKLYGLYAVAASQSRADNDDDDIESLAKIPKLAADVDVSTSNLKA